MRRIHWLLLSCVLAACQPGAGGTPGDAPPAEGASPVAGDEIATTSLDGTAAEEAPVALIPELALPAGGGTVDASAETGSAAETAVPPADGQKAAAPAGTAEAAEDGGEADDAAAGEEEAAVEEPQVVKSPEQLRCERRGGSFSSVAEGSNTKTCVQRTRDGGKRCDQESDCQGRCLARSMTCSPIDPLLGCNEIIQDNGAAVKLCIN